MVDPKGWRLEEFAASYRAGCSVTDVITAVLRLLDELPRGVLIGRPLWDAALRRARALDATHPASLPLYGVPFVVKDNIDVAGVATTAACPGIAFVAAEDATVIALLHAAGAIAVAKANLDQFATGLVGTRSPYGIPPNTIDASLVPGGSSSGSAVAVAFGAVPVALGTDTAGSGRVPAALNGIVGLKPTVGSASTFGIVPAVRRIDCPSVFARTVADAATVARIIRRPDRRDPYSRDAAAGRPFADPVRVGVVRAWPSHVEIHDDAARSYERSIARLEQLGAELHPVDIAPLLELGALLYGGPLVAERTAVAGDAIDKGVDGLDPVVAAIIARGHEYTAVDAYRAEYELAHLRSIAAPMWHTVDLLALPTTPRVATLEQLAADPYGANEAMGRFTTFANLADLAAVVVPMPGDAAAPFALQLLAPAWHDVELERVATGYQSGTLTAPAQPRTLVVVGAHLAGLPLNHQLTERRATLVRAARTSADYRLYALAGASPPKPGLVRVAPGTGAHLDVEVWSMGDAELGSFLAGVPSPLCIGTVTLDDGSSHPGFLCESEGLLGATDITSFGGWRAYLASR